LYFAWKCLKSLCWWWWWVVVVNSEFNDRFGLALAWWVVVVLFSLAKAKA
jgi:hypothetical protein